MSTTATPLRPGQLIALSVSVKPKHADAITLERRITDSKRTSTGAFIKKWSTTKVVADPEEHARAIRVRNRLRQLVRRVCVETDFGYICLDGRLEELDASLEECRRVRDEFNDGSNHFFVEYHHLRGQIHADSQEAVTAIRDQVGSLMQDLQLAIQAGEASTIRDVCNAARRMGQLLDDESDSHRDVSSAVAAGRRIARAIVRRVDNAGENIAQVLSEADQRPIGRARQAFPTRRRQGVASDPLPSVNSARLAVRERAEEPNNMEPSRR